MPETGLQFLNEAAELASLIPKLPVRVRIDVRRLWAAGNNQDALTLARAALDPNSKQRAGGLARLQKISPERRSEIAAEGGKKRWAIARAAGEVGDQPQKRGKADPTRLGDRHGMTELTVYEVIEVIKAKADKRTRYEAQLPFWDELLVAEIERLTALLEAYQRALRQTESLTIAEDE